MLVSNELLARRVASALRETEQPGLVITSREPAKDGSLGAIILVDTEDAESILARHAETPCIVLADPPPEGMRSRLRQGWRFRGAVECLFPDELSPIAVGLAIRASLVESKLSRLASAAAGETSPAQADSPGSLGAKTTFMLALQQAIDERRGGGEPFTLLLLEMQRYAQVVEGLGLEAADQLLAAVTQRLGRALTPRDTIGRVDDHRVALLVALDGEGVRARALAREMQRELRDPFIVSGESVYVSARMGQTSGSRDYETANDAMRDALAAVSRASTPGSSETFRTGFHDDAIGRVRIESALNQALAESQLRLHYQPIVSLASRRLLGFEALLRWQHPTLGLVPPYKFIPIAEESGLILPIGRWVMEQAARQLRNWDDEFELEQRLLVSVNVSGRQVLETNLVAEVERAIARTGLDPTCLKVEFTETMLMERSDDVAATIRELRAMGVQVWIDDFGTGYSSLRYLQRFPISGLKIDKSFVDPLDGSPANATMAQTIVGLAASMGVETVAEGIEHAHQADELIAMGCASGQGYWYSKPLSVADAYALLARGNGASLP